MSKQETLILKGIALLMMIMVHIDIYDSAQIVEWGNLSLWKSLSSICFPVPFFLMLSGYGLRHVYENGDMHHYGRIAKLFVHYWAVMFSFVIIGSIIIGTHKYPGDITTFINNITSFHTSYNYACWFLFPFAILSSSHPLIFKLFDKTGARFLLIACLLYFVSGFIISHYHFIYKTAPHGLYNLIQVFYMLFSFAIGAALKKYAIIEKMKDWTSGKMNYKVMAFLVLVVMMILGELLTTTAFHCFQSLIVFLMIVILIQGRTCCILKHIGEHSMNIWMIHTYILCYIFHKELYNLHYSIIIYVATLVLSLLCSYGINYITSGIDKKIYSYNL